METRLRPLLERLFPNHYDHTQYILCIDGGGVRGAICASVLKMIEQNILHRPVYEVFSRFVGTSTGSFISAGLASHRLTATEICDTIYTYETSKKIFTKTWLYYLLPSALLFRKYVAEEKAKILHEFFGDATFNDLPPNTKLLIATENWSKKSPSLWHNFSLEGVPQAKIADVCDASSAAPTFFPPVQVFFASNYAAPFLSLGGSGTSFLDNNSSQGGYQSQALSAIVSAVRESVFPVTERLPETVAVADLDSMNRGSFATCSTTHSRNYFDISNSAVPSESGDVHVDGGLNSNTPCTTAYAFCQHDNYQKGIAHNTSVFLLSLGTGSEGMEFASTSNDPYTRTKENNRLKNMSQWGMFNWLWNGVVNRSQESPNQINCIDCALLLGDNFLRIDSSLPSNVPYTMDFYSKEHLDALKKVGETWYYENEQDLRKFFSFFKN